MTKKKIVNQGAIRIIIAMSLIIVLLLVALSASIHNISYLLSKILILPEIASIILCIIYIVIAAKALRKN